MSLTTMRERRAGPAGPTIVPDPRHHAPWGLRVWRNHLTFRGRAGRRAFFVRVFTVLFTGITLGMVVRVLELTVPAYGLALGLLPVVLVPLALLPFALTFLCLWSLLSLAARRLHDAGASGWWALLVLPLPVFVFVALVYHGFARLDEAAVAAGLLGLGLCAIVGARPGTQGPNRYGEGPDPHDPAPIDASLDTSAFT